VTLEQQGSFEDIYFDYPVITFTGNSDLKVKLKTVQKIKGQNIYADGELNKERTSAKIAQVQLEGKRQVSRNVEFYNLDVIL